jgi:hypothetical protein
MIRRHSARAKRRRGAAATTGAEGSAVTLLARAVMKSGKTGPLGLEPTNKAWKQKDLRANVTTHVTTDADLGLIIDAWVKLPEAVKVGILAMVRAAR